MEVEVVRTVWITRHGERRDAVDPQWFQKADRPYDTPLSSYGVRQARLLGERLAAEKIAHIFSSPFLRCVETANEIAELLDLPIQIEWGLCEWLHPDWFSARPKTLPIETLAQRFPRIDTRCPSRTQVSYPETEAALLRRSGDTVTDLIAQVSEDLLIVGHAASVWGASARLLRSRESGDSAVPYIVPCCSLIKLTRQKRGWVLELNADTSHLS